MKTLVTYSAPNVRRTGPAAFASHRSYYFRMYIANFRARQCEACESDSLTWAQVRSWFRQASAVALSNPYLRSA